MKLVYAIVSSDDDNRVMAQLNKNNFSVTKLATTGGFLRSGNTTLIIGTEEEQVDKVIGIITAECGERKHIVANPVMTSNYSDFTPQPVSVDVGGAIIFVLDVEQFIKI